MPILSVPDEAHWLIRKALAADIKASITSSRLAGCKGVYESLFPDDKMVDAFPCIFCTIEGGSEQMTGAGSEGDNWEYPVNIWIAERMSRFQGKTDDDKFLFQWRKQLLNLFNRRIASTSNLGACTWIRGTSITPGPICDPRLPQYQYLASGLTFKALTSEPRLRNTFPE